MTDTPLETHLLFIPKAAQVTGYTEKAIRRKIQDGVWLDGYEYHKAPDGRITIDMKGYEKWVKGERVVGRK